MSIQAGQITPVQSFLERAPGTEISKCLARGVGYVAMQINPFDFRAFTDNPQDRTMLGYVGLSMEHGELTHTAQMTPGNAKDTELRARTFISILGGTFLPESPKYGKFALSEIFDSIHDDQPLSLLFVEQDSDSRAFLTLVANRLLGEQSLNLRFGRNRREPVVRPATNRTEAIAQNITASRGAAGREALIVGGAAIIKMSDIELPKPKKGRR